VRQCASFSPHRRILFIQKLIKLLCYDGSTVHIHVCEKTTLPQNDVDKQTLKEKLKFRSTHDSSIEKGMWPSAMARAVSMCRDPLHSPLLRGPFKAHNNSQCSGESTRRHERQTETGGRAVAVTYQQGNELGHLPLVGL